jgi:hypothetical protein
MRPLRRPSSWAAAALAIAALSPRSALCAGPLELRAEPPSLVAGTGQGAVVVIEVGPGSPPAVTTSVGRTENLRSMGDGRFAVDYVPPTAANPQVAIVAAVADDRWGWTSIPLSGRGVATARSAPGAAIRVTIGDASFGPVRADDAGNATVPVIVPAGVTCAYHGRERLELDIPPTLHVHVALGRASAAADVEQVIPFRIFAVEAAGKPRTGAPILVQAERGDVGEVVEIAAGEYAGRWRLPPGPAGTARVSASLNDEAELVSAAALDRVAGPAARVSLEAERHQVVAGTSEPIVIRARVTDAAGNGVEAAPSLEATEGELSAPVAVARGTWEASLAVRRTARAGQAVVTARAAGLEGRLAIEVMPPLESGVPRERSVSVAAKLGVAAARGGVWSPMVAAECGLRPGFLDRRLALVLEAGALVRDRTDEVPVGAELVAVHGRVRYAPVIASARLELPIGARQLGWAAAGAGVALVASDVSAAALPAQSESGVAPAVSASVGWGLRAGRATPFAEAGLVWMGDPGFDALRGSLTVLTVSLGCRYDAY